MPRPSADSLAVAPVVDVGRARLLPDTDLAPAEQRAFSVIVRSVAGDHFREGDRLLVTQLARAVVIADAAAAELDRQGLIVDGAPNPLIRVVREQARLVASLATKCRLTTQSRISKDKAGRTEVDPIAQIDFRRLNRG
jgi:hypothetical protein